MEKRIHSLDEIRELEKYLTFTRFDVHTTSPAVRNIISDLCEIFENNEDKAEYTSLYRLLGIYFTFCARDKKKAAEYLEKYINFCNKNGSKDIEARCYLGYAYSLDRNEKNPKFFTDVIAELPTESGNIPATIIRAFALQNLALMLHRQSIRDKAKDIDTALVYIKTAISLQEKILETYPPIKIGLAESLLIFAVMLASRIQEKRNYLEEADLLFQRASALAELFCEETKSQHFLRPIIRQSHAMTLASLNQHEIAHSMLHEALREQRAISTHPVDITKSLYLLGKFHSEKKEFPLAVEYYLESLKLMMNIEYDDNEILIKIQNFLLAALHCIRDNKLLALELREKILRDMKTCGSDPVNPCEDFIQLIEHEQMELKKEQMDEISMKFMSGCNTLFGGMAVRPMPKENKFDKKTLKFNAPCA